MKKERNEWNSKKDEKDIKTKQDKVVGWDVY